MSARAALSCPATRRWRARGAPGRRAGTRPRRRAASGALGACGAPGVFGAPGASGAPGALGARGARAPAAAPPASRSRAAARRSRA